MEEQGRSTVRQNKSKVRNISPISNEMGRIPPQAVDLEEAVLGALMLEKDALTAVIDILRPEAFYKPAHQMIYQAIQNLFKSRSR